MGFYFRMDDIIKDTELVLYGENNNVIADSDDLEDIYTFIYGCWEFLYVAEDLASARDKFNSVFQRWNARNLHNFQMMYDALMAQYNPIENYDRHEEGGWNDSGHTVTNNTSHTESSASASDTHSAEDKVAAFNSSDYEKNNKDTSTDTSSNSGQSDGSSDGEVTSSNSHTFNGYRVHGNIGVTTSMQMIQQEIEGRKIDLAKVIISQFVNDYCILAERG